MENIPAQTSMTIVCAWTDRSTLLTRSHFDSMIIPLARPPWPDCARPGLTLQLPGHWPLWLRPGLASLSVHLARPQLIVGPGPGHCHSLRTSTTTITTTTTTTIITTTSTTISTTSTSTTLHCYHQHHHQHHHQHQHYTVIINNNKHHHHYQHHTPALGQLVRPICELDVFGYFIVFSFQNILWVKISMLSKKAGRKNVCHLI